MFFGQWSKYRALFCFTFDTTFQHLVFAFLAGWAARDALLDLSVFESVGIFWDLATEFRSDTFRESIDVCFYIQIKRRGIYVWIY